MDRVLVSDAPVGRLQNPRRRFEFRSAGATDTGTVREHNEDFVFAGHNLIAVADGVGGNVFGEVASETVARAIGYLEDRIYLAAPDDEAREAVAYANQRLAESVERNRALAGMATTLTALRLDGPLVVTMHVGDSRAYRSRDGAVTRITRDDSYVQALVDGGAIAEDDARRHPARSVVLQALDGGPVSPHTTSSEVRSGDRYLVCSDGLSDYVEDAAIGRVLLDQGDPNTACRRLIDVALEAGSRDNVSCVVADVRPLTR